MAIFTEYHAMIIKMFLEYYYETAEVFSCLFA